MIKRMYDYKKVKHPFCHFIQHGGCFVRATSESLASIGFIYTFASGRNDGAFNGTNAQVADAAKSVAEQVKQAPAGTVYGVVENTKHHVVVNTPFGRYTIEKKDGGVSFMGMSAKVVSAKNGVYHVKSSLGNFSVNTRKGTITKK